jgi:putative transcriptional regulator
VRERIKIKLQGMMWERRVRSISELARRAGVSRQTVDALYNRPDKVKGIQFETLESLCRALDCRIEDLTQDVPESAMGTQLQIGEVREGDSDYAAFRDLADEPAALLEECDELFERLDQIRRQRDSQD